MPKTKRAAPLYRRGAFRLYRREGRTNLEIIWYDLERRRERSASAGTGDLQGAKLELDRRYLEGEGQRCCPTCGRPMDGETAPLLTSAIRDYLIRGQEKAGFKTTRGRLSHAVEFIAETDHLVTLPQADEQFVARFRRWLAQRPVVTAAGKRLRARSLGHIEGCIRQLAAAINATAGHVAKFKAEQPKHVSRSPTYRADIATLAQMFSFCIDPSPPQGKEWMSRERAKVISGRIELLRYLRAAVATWARPEAIFDIRPSQWQASARVLDLNPEGRRQTKKHRPKIPIARQFVPWLDEMMPVPGNPGRSLYLTNTSIRHSWENLRQALALPGRGEAGPKLIRRSMATLARKRMGEANWAQGKLMLGHGKFDISDIYAIPDPANLGLALLATESIIDEIEQFCPGAFCYSVSANADRATTNTVWGLNSAWSG